MKSESKKFCVALNIDGALRQDDLTGSLADGLCEMSDQKVRQILNAAKEQGYIVFTGCDNHDERGYCLGHKEFQPIQLEDVGKGDAVLIHKTIRNSLSNYINLWLPSLVDRGTSKQFVVVEGRSESRYKRENGARIGSSGRCPGHYPDTHARVFSPENDETNLLEVVKLCDRVSEKSLSPLPDLFKRSLFAHHGGVKKSLTQNAPLIQEIEEKAKELSKLIGKLEVME